MNSKPEKQDPVWTLPALKELLESKIDGNDRRYQQRFDAQEAANKYSQEKSNEFRGSLEDIGKKQMPRTEAEALIRASEEKAAATAKANSEKIDSLQARMDRWEGRSGGLTSGWGYLVAAVGLAAAVISIVIATTSNR